MNSTAHQQSSESQASCACGRLSIRLRGAPRLVSSCHCLECQKRTGALFGSSAYFERGQVIEIQGESRMFQRYGTSGASLEFHFCPNCGSNVYWYNMGVPDSICVAVGSFADPEFPAPIRTIWAATRHRWLEFPSTIPQHPAAPR